MAETESWPGGSLVADLAENFKKLYDGKLIKVEDGVLIAQLPEGVRLESIKELLDEYAERPDRRSGTALAYDLSSFVALANRFKDSHSAIFANPDPKAPSLIAVHDYHDTGARFGEHRAVYTCPLSDEWKAWHGKDGQQMGQGDFAEFIENRIGDVLVPPGSFDDDQLQQFVNLVGGRFADPVKLLELSRGLEVNAAETVKQAVSLATGEISVTYNQSHSDGRGEPIKVPNLFLIGIPVFRSGAGYRIPVRLRYRVAQQTLRWSFHLYRADRVFDDAFGELTAKANEQTGLPVYAGQQEKTGP